MKQTDTEKQEVDLQVDHRKLELMFAAIPSSMLASLYGSIVAILIFNGVISNLRLYSWVAIMLAVSGFRYHIYLRYSKARPTAEQRGIWYVNYRIGTLFQAFAVGSANLLLFHFSDGSYQTLLALMMIAICAFAISNLAPHRPIALAFMLIAFLPLVLMVSLQASELNRYIALILLLLLGMLIFSTFRLNTIISNSIRFNIEGKLREEKLRDYQQRLSMFVEDAPLAVIEWDLAQHVLQWNPEAENVFGYSKERAFTLGWADLMCTTKDADLQQMWDRMLTKFTGERMLLENLRADGKLILCEWVNTPLVDASNQVVGLMSLIQDVTERIANERIKKEFVSIVSHELRTPLTSIKGGLGLLCSGVLDDDKEKSKQMLDIALSNTNRLQLLINDILDVEKLESGKMEYRFSDIDPVQLIAEVIEANSSYAVQYSVQVVQDVMPANCLVHMDQDRIFQVLSNLLSNAIKFSVTDGEVLVSVRVTEDFCRIMVNNRGELIPESDRENMFAKFFQRDSSTTRAKGGTGLGLYICQKILQEHGSMLDFESTQEQGTTFFFDLPRARQRLPEAYR